MRKKLNIIDSINTADIDFNNIDQEAVIIDELTGEVIAINYDVITGNRN